MHISLLADDDVITMMMKKRSMRWRQRRAGGAHCIQTWFFSLFLILVGPAPLASSLAAFLQSLFFSLYSVRDEHNSQSCYHIRIMSTRKQTTTIHTQHFFFFKKIKVQQSTIGRKMKKIILKARKMFTVCYQAKFAGPINDKW